MSDLQQRVSGATVEDLIACNTALKLARELVAQDIKLLFPVLDKISVSDQSLFWCASERKSHIISLLVFLLSMTLVSCNRSMKAHSMVTCYCSVPQICMIIHLSVIC